MHNAGDDDTSMVDVEIAWAAFNCSLYSLKDDNAARLW